MDNNLQSDRRIIEASKWIKTTKRGKEARKPQALSEKIEIPLTLQAVREKSMTCILKNPLWPPIDPGSPSWRQGRFGNLSGQEADEGRTAASRGQPRRAQLDMRLI